MRSLFAQIDMVDNGYVVKFPEASKESRPLPNPYDQINEANLTMFLDLTDLANEDGSDEWKGSQREEKRKRVKERLAQLRQEHAGRVIEVWVLKEREYICVGFEGIQKALEAARTARETIRQLQEQGVQIFGAVGLMCVPGAHMG